MNDENFTVIRQARRDRAVNFNSTKSLIFPRPSVGLRTPVLFAVFMIILPIMITTVSAQTPTPTAVRNENQNTAVRDNQTTANTNTTAGNSQPESPLLPNGDMSKDADYHGRVIVTEVYNSQYKTSKNLDKREAGLNDIIIVRVENLEELVRWSKCEEKIQPKPCVKNDIVLYINGREISGLEPESGAPKLDTETTAGTENQEAPITSSGELRYHLQRITDSPESGRDNSEHWSDLLGLRLDNLSGNQNYSIRDNLKRGVEVSVGLAGNYPVKTLVKAPDNQFYLIRLRGGYWIGAWIIIMIFIIGGLIWLAITSDLLRDRTAVLYNKRKPYSLGAFQAAWWFAIVLLSFIFIWLVTGQNDLSGTALILLGIGLGTTLGANIIDVNKRNASNNTQLGSDKLKTLLTEKATLETKLAALNRNSQAFRSRDTEYQVKCQEIRESFPNAIGPSQKGFLLDILSDVNGISFHRFQLFVWTIILGLFFIISALGRLAMPQFSETLLALMGISAGAFLGFKAPENSSLPVPPPPPPGSENGGSDNSEDPSDTQLSGEQTTPLSDAQNNALPASNTERN